MSESLSLATLNSYTKFFNKLAEDGLKFDIELTRDYDQQNGGYRTSFLPKLRESRTMSVISKFFTAKSSPIPVRHFTDATPLGKYLQTENVKPATANDAKVANSPVKFFAQESFATNPGLQVFNIIGKPVEVQEGDRSYRILINGKGVHYAELVMCIDDQHPAYNYIDPGHIIVFATSFFGGENAFFVTNQLTLDMNYLIAAFSVHPPCLDELYQAKTRYINSRDARIMLLKAERAIPPRMQPKYKEVKATVLADFEKNAQNVMISKLIRKEAEAIEVNNIKISNKKATYETISLEADDLVEIVTKKLNPVEEWDIFTLVNIYTDHVQEMFDGLPLNNAFTGFAEAKTHTFKVNGITLKIGVSTTNTRRYVNDLLINKNELSKVMRRASCMHEQADFDAFVAQVSRMSLRVTEVLGRGLPVKTSYLDTDNRRDQDATEKHPKLKFKKENNKFYVIIDEDTTKLVKRFVSFIDKVEANNRKFHKPYHQAQTHEGGYETGTAPNDCAKSLVTIMDEFIEGLTDEQKTKLVAAINKERIEAEKRSELLLAQACKITGAVREQRNGKYGYVIQGQMRKYFVEEDALRVYDADTNKYYCVVNGKGNQGVGRDALVTRLFALKNDKMVADKIGTLK